MTNRIAVNESMREHAINAAGSGHDLTGFDLVQDQDGRPNGYEVRCRRCNLSAWVGDLVMMYSLLAAACPWAVTKPTR